MKGKLLVFFLLALAAIIVIGIIGRSTITQAIESIRQSSVQDVDKIFIDRLSQNLLEAEASVRTFTITGNEGQLSLFAGAASEVDVQLSELKRRAHTLAQEDLLASIESLIEQKFGNYSTLIELKSKEGDTSAMDQVIANIESMKEQDTTTAGGSGAVFRQLFGETDEGLMSDSLFNATEKDLQSEELGEAIEQIRVEAAQDEARRRSEELRLTQLDYKTSEKLRTLIEEYQDIEREENLSQAQEVAKASERANLYITIISIVTVLAFAVLIYILFRDLVRDQRNKEALKEAKENAEFLASAKEEFLSTMSHEIRTPLGAIIGFSEQLASSPNAKNTPDTIRKIEKSGKHLLTVVNDILDAARLESGKIELEKINFNFHEEINGIVELLADEAKRKGLTITVDIDSSVPEFLKGDPIRLRQILINLISNAIKFSDKGLVRVETTTAVSDSKNYRVNFKVSDSGIGIPETRLSSIFEDFTQADMSTTRKYGGTGLGLSIVKKLVDLHGGTITAQSEVDKGSTFSVEIPYEIGYEEELPTTKVEVPDLTGKKVLVVDDQSFNLEIAGNLLKKCGANKILVQSGKEALKLTGETKFDLILLDLQMPDIGGLEVAKAIREDNSVNKETPILALTADTSDDTARNIKRVGMEDILLKPVDKHLFYKKISEYLDSDVTHLNLSELDALANGDDSFVKRMLELFEINISADKELLREAVSNNDTPAIRSLAHKMIPPCRHLGLDALTSELKLLEAEENSDNYVLRHESVTLKIQEAIRLVRKKLENMPTHEK